MPDSIFSSLALFAAGSVGVAYGGCPHSSTAVSDEAVAVHEQFSKVSALHESSLALFGNKSQLFDDLRNLAEECSEADWDGYGAKAVNHEVVACAGAFVRALPYNISAPTLSADPDGEISFDWMIPSKSKTFTLSINRDNRLSYAWIDGTSRGSATESFKDGVLPDRVIEEIKRITNHATTIGAA